MENDIKLFGNRKLPGGKTLIMGILNVNDDSFYAASRTLSIEDAIARAKAMAEAGADILDIGAESTRPGSAGIAAAEELEALIPVVETIRYEFSNLPISVDTRKARVAKEAIAAGADIVNDVSGLELSEEAGPMMRLVAETGVLYVLMHTKGTPETMQASPNYDDFLGELDAFFENKLKELNEAGVAQDRIVLDPGVGFGKRLNDNLDILAHIPSLKKYGLPLLIGTSRKGFIGRLTGRADAEKRLEGTLATTAICAYEGAEIVRVHDVAENAKVAALADAVRGRRSR